MWEKALDVLGKLRPLLEKGIAYLLGWMSGKAAGEKARLEAALENRKQGDKHMDDIRRMSDDDVNKLLRD